MSGRLGHRQDCSIDLVRMSSSKCQLLFVDEKAFEDGELEYW